MQLAVKKTVAFFLSSRESEIKRGGVVHIALAGNLFFTEDKCRCFQLLLDCLRLLVQSPPLLAFLAIKESKPSLAQTTYFFYEFFHK